VDTGHTRPVDRTLTLHQEIISLSC
jgi:hypothetical protein